MDRQHNGQQKMDRQHNDQQKNDKRTNQKLLYSIIIFF